MLRSLLVGGVAFGLASATWSEDPAPRLPSPRQGSSPPLQDVKHDRTSAAHEENRPLAPLAIGLESNPFDPFNLLADPRAHKHPHGRRFCASGCVLSNHPTPELPPPRFHQLLALYATEPMGEESRALEALLFHGRQTHELLQREGAGPLDEPRAAFLRRELRRVGAYVALRVVDENGDVRVALPFTRVPLDIRHVFEMDVVGLQMPLVTSGTVKRVGLHHIWQRI